MNKKDLEIFNNIVEKARKKATIYISENELETLIKIKKELENKGE